MNRLEPEVQLSIFQELDSKEMVKVMRVSKNWSNIIEQNKRLWRRLVLPVNENRAGWSVATLESILRRFDRKSESNLKEVSVRLDFPRKRKDLDDCDFLETLAQILLKSSQSLRYLNFLSNCKGNISGTQANHIADLSWRLPNLIDCRIDTDVEWMIHLKDGPKKSQETPSSGLQVLWAPISESLYRNHANLLNSVVSLHVEVPLNPETWKKVLKNCHASKLKDLEIDIASPIAPVGVVDGFIDDYIDLDLNEAPDPASIVHFPNLEVFCLHSDEEIFPSWIKIPTSCTLILLNSELLQPLPSVSKIRAPNCSEFGGLELRCPVLEELRVGGQPNFEDFCSMLRSRKEKVDEKAEIDDVEMCQIKRIVGRFSQSQISELRELVEEVVDDAKAPRRLEVEV